MKVLIIEDDSSIRETLKDVLEINGYEVILAQDGPDGVCKARDGIDLILCDVGLPGMDGYEVITQIQKIPECRSIPFLFLTARAERSDQRKGMALGADDFITKPFTEREILEAIDASLRRRRPLKERVESLLGEKRREMGAEWSHELMTPLSAVLGGLQLIEAEIDTISREDLRELLGVIRDGAERQQTLSRKLICYFDLERQRVAPGRPSEYCCQAVDLIPPVVRRVASDHRRSTDLNLDCQPCVLLLPDQHLQVAVGELVDNAFRFSTPGDPVLVRCFRDGPCYRIEVTDRGVGMNASERNAIGPFIQFRRHKLEQQGLGLGLFIAQSVGELWGGSLTLKDGPGGRGLEAVLALPLAADS